MTSARELHDLTGIIHVHSRYSDGTGTVTAIARAARRNRLDFLLLTDHDTLEAKSRGEEGWHGSVLILVGEEVSPRRRNHYLAFGVDQPIAHRGLSPQQIVDRVNEAGGFGFPAHPFSRGSPRFERGGQGMPWDDLEASGFTGLELWSFVTDTAEKLESIPDVLRFLLAPRRFLDHPPRRNLDQWDRICQRRRCVALGGVDAHQVGIKVGRFVPLRLMAYSRSFRHLRTHLLSEQPLEASLAPDRERVFSALRAGRAYIAVDSIAPASGFRFHCEGDQPLEMGDEGAAARARTLHTALPHPARVRLLKDGVEVASAPEARSLDHEPDGPGVYRVEAYKHARGRERTWIISNPIYLR